MAESIPTPGNTSHTSSSSGATVTSRLEWGSGFGSRKTAAFSQAQKFVDNECLRYMNPLTPRLTGFMIKSATIGTVIGSGEIQYNAPYARQQYYENHGEGQRGRLWFDRMKAQHKDDILRGAGELAGR